MFAAVVFVAIADRAKRAEGAGHHGFRLAPHKTFGGEAIADQIGDADQAQSVLARIRLQLRQPGHRAIGILDLADHAGGIQASQA